MSLLLVKFISVQNHTDGLIMTGRWGIVRGLLLEWVAGCSLQVAPSAVVFDLGSKGHYSSIFDVGIIVGCRQFEITSTQFSIGGGGDSSSADISGSSNTVVQLHRHCFR